MKLIFENEIIFHSLMWRRWRRVKRDRDKWMQMRKELTFFLLLLNTPLMQALHAATIQRSRHADKARHC